MTAGLIEKRRFLPAIGAGLGTTVVVLAAFSASLIRCRAENQTHHPHLCVLSDRHPGYFALAALLLGVMVFALGVSTRAMVATRAASAVLGAAVAVTIALFLT